MAAENAQIEPGDTVAVWGCGPVGQFAIQSAWMFNAGRVFAIDCVPERLELARTYGKAETIDFSQEKVYDRLMEATKGRGRIVVSMRSAPRRTAPVASMRSWTASSQPCA